VNDRNGVLVLSENAGAYEELGDLVVGVDPFDVDAQASALRRAVELEPEGRRNLLAGIRARVRTHDLEAWAERELGELETRAPAAAV
jgi:trehalose 6-phosphate synthase